MKKYFTRKRVIALSILLALILVIIALVIINNRPITSQNDDSDQVVTSSSSSEQSSSSTIQSATSASQSSQATNPNAGSTFELKFQGSDFDEKPNKPLDRYRLSYDPGLGFKYSMSENPDSNSATFINGSIRIDLRLVDSGSYSYLSADTLKMEIGNSQVPSKVTNSEWGDLYRYTSDSLGVYIYGAKFDKTTKTLDKYVKVDLAYDFFTVQITCNAATSQSSKCDQFVSRLRNVL